MTDNIKKEFLEFNKYHRNIYNICFHIICGFIFMSFLFLLSKTYSNLLLVLYSFMLFFTIHNLLITLSIFSILFIMVYIIKKYKISKTNIFILFLVFYFLPELSHYLTKEKTVLNINNITFSKIFINIFYLLPYSMLCLNSYLSNTK